MLGVRKRIQPSCSKHLLGTYQGEKEIPMRLHMPRDCAWQRRQEAQDEAVRKEHMSNSYLIGRNEEEARIDRLLRRARWTIAHLPMQYTPEERVKAMARVGESGMLVFDYVLRLEGIIDAMEQALAESLDRTEAMEAIVRVSRENCESCLHARNEKRAAKCADVDCDCIICPLTDCPCRNCRDGSGYVWNGECRVLQKPIELYPGKHVPLYDVVRVLPIFIEHRYTKDIAGGLYDSQRDMFYFSDTGDDDGGRWLDNEEQGETWRAWLVYPTQKDRDAAPWKEVPNNEGLTEEELHENG